MYDGFFMEMNSKIKENPSKYCFHAFYVGKTISITMHLLTSLLHLVLIVPNVSLVNTRRVLLHISEFKSWSN